MNATKLALAKDDVIEVEATPAIRHYGIELSAAATTVKFRVVSFGYGVTPSGHPPVCVLIRFETQRQSPLQTIRLELVGNGLPIDGLAVDVFLHQLEVVEHGNDRHDNVNVSTTSTLID